jgi:hypothetical protein
MNFNDLIIIYLACGAPFGVYYFLQNRHTNDYQTLWLKTVVNFIFWIPFALRILSENKALKKLFGNIFDQQIGLDAENEKKTFMLRKNLETAIIRNIPQNKNNIPKLSVFEVREVLERYTGLTISCKSEKKNPQYSQEENEFYKISAHLNPKLASICIERRNRKRLSFHQTQARRDFLNLFGNSENNELLLQTLEFAKVLEDFDTVAELEKIISRKVQTKIPENVYDTENEIWKPVTHKPLAISQTTSAHLKLSPAKMNLRSKD